MNVQNVLNVWHNFYVWFEFDWSSGSQYNKFHSNGFDKCISCCNWTRTQNHLVHKGTYNYKVWIHSEKRAWHDKNIQSNAPTDKYSQHSSIIWRVWLNGWVFVYSLNGCRFESNFSHLNFRFHACFEQGVPWHSGNYIVWIHSEMRNWHDKNIQANASRR